MGTSSAKSQQSLTIALYRRTGVDLDQSTFSFFTTGSNGGATWDGHRLMIQSSFGAVNVDLLWDDRSQTWSGRFARGSFRAQVVLKRPAADKPPSPFVGVWINSGGAMNNCLHIVPQGNALAAWSDDLQMPDQSRFASPSGLWSAGPLMEHYGEIAQSTLIAPDWITVVLRAFTPACCPHAFNAQISPDRATLKGKWLSGPNQSAGAIIWKRVTGDSCLTPAT